MSAVIAGQIELLPRGTLASGLVEIAAGEDMVAFEWGEIHVLGTAAYWVEQTRRRPEPRTYRLGGTLAEEVAACILGGYGIPAAVGLAAYERLHDAGLLQAPIDPAAIRAALARPLSVPGRSRPVRYRFATQRAERVAAALTRLYSCADVPTGPRRLRSLLLDLPGIGPKTASWIVRNWTAADGIAIVDVHVRRAGVAAGFFSPDWQLPRHYDFFEEAFCAVATLGGVSTASLDACIWDQMQALGRAKALFFAGA